VVGILRALRQDWAGFRERLSPTAPPEPGLYTYRFTPPGGQIRIHLRIEPDGAGVLSVDVTDVVHLNPTAAELAKWALEGTPAEVAAARLNARHGAGHRDLWRRDLDGVYAMVARFTGPGQGCPTCALENIERTALFSTPVSAPLKADLALTYDCNNDCPHCYNEADRFELAPLSGDQWQQVIDRLCVVGIPHLIFTGGEATLHPDLCELIEYADGRGPLCGLNSNGRRLAHRGFAEELAAAGLNHIQITLGSHRAEVHDRMMNANSFRQTVRGIENAQACGIHTITNTTLMRMNAEEIEDTIDFLHGLGIRTFAVNGMIYSGGGFDTGQAIAEEELAATLVVIRDKAREKQMRLLWYTPTQYCHLSPVELELEPKRCNAGEYSLCIEPNGDVLPCQSYYVAAGNILRDPWRQIWKSELFRSFRDREQDPELGQLPEICRDCADLPLCGGGCRIERDAQNGLRAAEGSCGSGGCAGGSCGSGGLCASGETRSPGFVDIAALAPPSAANANSRRATGEFKVVEVAR